ncbi:transforming growth factor-beta-induced protein ig-h3, partial [Biomphalaria glabrata]
TCRHQSVTMKYFCLVITVVISLTRGQTVSPFPDVVSALTASGHFETFLDLLKPSGLLERINSSSHFTLFAPTDDAFAKLPADTFNALKSDPNQLALVLGYHVVLSSSFKAGTQQDTVLKSSNGLPIRINTYSLIHSNAASGVNITLKNIPVVHGYIQGVNTVLNPPIGNIVQIAMNRTDLKTFTSWVISSNLVQFFLNDDDVTLFVPSDDAIKKLSPATLDYLNSHPSALTDVLKYHVMSDYTLFTIGMTHSMTLKSADQHHDLLMILEDGNGGLFVNHAKIVERDIACIEGVLHIIDNVLIPPHVLVAIQDASVAICAIQPSCIFLFLLKPVETANHEKYLSAACCPTFKTRLCTDHRSSTLARRGRCPGC